MKANKGLVVATGVFDILHPGHVYFLEKAKALGKRLVVIVARDETVMKMKNRAPVNSEKDRLHMVSSLKCVNSAVLGHDYADKTRIIGELSPDFIALGHDQKIHESSLKKELGNMGLSPKIVRIGKMDGTYS